jgi:hypothetical protein
MQTLDLIIIFGYLIGVTLFGVWFSSRQETTEDYFVGDRNVPWWAIAASIVATETSTITFISVPGIAFAKNGNFQFLQLVFGYMLGRVVRQYGCQSVVGDPGGGGKAFYVTFSRKYADKLGINVRGAVKEAGSVVESVRWINTELRCERLKVLCPDARPLLRLAKDGGYFNYCTRIEPDAAVIRHGRHRRFGLCHDVLVPNRQRGDPQIGKHCRPGFFLLAPSDYLDFKPPVLVFVALLNVNASGEHQHAVSNCVAVVLALAENLVPFRLNALVLVLHTLARECVDPCAQGFCPAALGAQELAHHLRHLICRAALWSAE